MPEQPQLGRIEDKLDKMSDRLNSVDVTLAKQHVTLEDHIYRTQLAEAAIEKLQKDLDPLKKTHYVWATLGKAVATLGMGGSVFFSILKWLLHVI